MGCIWALPRDHYKDPLFHSPLSTLRKTRIQGTVMWGVRSRGFVSRVAKPSNPKIQNLNPTPSTLF